MSVRVKRFRGVSVRIWYPENYPMGIITLSYDGGSWDTYYEVNAYAKLNVNPLDAIPELKRRMRTFLNAQKGV